MVFLGIQETYQANPSSLYFDFRAKTYKKLSTQSQFPNSSVSTFNRGFGVTITGNSWIYFPFPYTVTYQTVIEFEFWCDNQPASSFNSGTLDRSEPQKVGIGLSNTERLRSGDGVKEFLQVYGTDLWGKARYLSVGTPGEIKGDGSDRYASPQDTSRLGTWVKYECALGMIGDSALGAKQWLYLVAEHDTYGKSNVQFRNVRVYEDRNLMRLASQPISMSDQDADLNPSFSRLFDNNYSVAVSNNGWKAVRLPRSYTITKFTILEVWFRNVYKGEIHAVGLFESTGKFAVINGKIQGNYNQLRGYVYQKTGIQEAFYTPAGIYPQYEGQWIKYQLPWANMNIVNTNVTHLAVIADNDNGTAAVKQRRKTEVAMVRLYEPDYSSLPPINPRFLFRSDRGVSTDASETLNQNTAFVSSWHSSYGEYVEVDADATNKPFYVKRSGFLASNYGDYPAIRGRGNGMVSDYLPADFHGSNYVCWIVLNLTNPTIRQYLCTFKGDQPGEEILVSLYNRSVNYQHQSPTASKSALFSIPSDAVNKTGLITVYKDEKFHSIQVNGQELATKLPIDPVEYKSTMYSVSLLGNSRGVGGFLSELYYVAISNDPTDITNKDEINKWLQFHFGIPV